MQPTNGQELIIQPRMGPEIRTLPSPPPECWAYRCNMHVWQHVQFYRVLRVKPRVSWVLGSIFLAIEPHP